MAEIAERLEYGFSDDRRLVHALTHRSWCAENDSVEHNERLEFLGDAVLGLIVTDDIYHRFPDMPEGHLAKVRADVVSAGTLAELAESLHLGEGLLLGKGEETSGGRYKASILADAMEAVIGAVYTDGGWDPVRRLVLRLLGDRIAVAAAGPGGTDFKTRLQEELARTRSHMPHYQVEGEGPDHDKRFVAVVSVGGAALGEGRGRTKKQAEQAAAAVAWLVINDGDGSARNGLGPPRRQP